MTTSPGARRAIDWQALNDAVAPVPTHTRTIVGRTWLERSTHRPRVERTRRLFIAWPKRDGRATEVHVLAAPGGT